MRVHKSKEGGHTLHGSPEELRAVVASLNEALAHVAVLDAQNAEAARARGQAQHEVRPHGDVSVVLPGCCLSFSEAEDLASAMEAGL